VTILIYCLRAVLAGFRILYIPSALMDKEKFFSNDNWEERSRKKNGNVFTRYVIPLI